MGKHTYGGSTELVSHRELICCCHREPRGHNSNEEYDLKHLQIPAFILAVTEAASPNVRTKHFKAGVGN